ncbi:uncharacterized protein LOC107421095 isoform X1 [Ziziphus jujuba]|uniref:Uncharacterized protein LOC107421095 isoform X1 n=1 Tax=Ziziphus jujuba TaxID=326968 RepID=A0A6P4AIX6_ZIZJJ|nr:uncharacterized protein LOC107421095 isoform X1 [Ziziphus jujuba]
MGNCLRSESAMVWAGEDWGSLKSKSHQHHQNTMHYGGVDDMEKQRLLHEIRASSSSSSSSSSLSNDCGTSRELKIKISKKELDQLIGRTGGMQGLTVEQFLSQLVINNGGGDHRPCWLDHQRSWRPALQSIPEGIKSEKRRRGVDIVRMVWILTCSFILHFKRYRWKIRMGSYGLFIGLFYGSFFFSILNCAMDF